MIRAGRIFAAAVLLAAMMLSSAGAEVYLNAEKPADWEERELMKIHFMDFVQNDAFILQCGGKVMLIDGGTKKHWEKYRDYLEEHGLTHADILFNTHPHDDHMGAIYNLINHDVLTADQFISPFEEDYKEKDGLQQKLVKLLREKGIPYHQMMPEEELEFGGVRMILYRYLKGDTNSKSGVLWVHFGEATILLPADLTGEGERYLANTYGSEGLKSDIMKSPHHGIIRMVSEFLEAVNPELTIITNRKNCNAKKQLDARGYENIFTSVGPVDAETDGKDWYVTQERNK
jgi:competence protein ComEC